MTGATAKQALRWLCIAAAMPLSACSLGNSLTTGSILGGSQTSAAQTTAAAAPPPAPVSDPTGRAFQVGAVSARASKCGYNFDPVKLRTNFLAAEAKLGAAPADLQKIGQIYDVSRNGVTKAVAGKSGYCTEKKTAEIKEDLTRHLAGDYTPHQRKAEVVEEDGGLFGDFGADGGPSDAMAKKQVDAIGR